MAVGSISDTPRPSVLPGTAVTLLGTVVTRLQILDLWIFSTL
ncbi:hypothetical protein A2U01_0057378, partial [Trifolium medium]|nr:hypothetical protein [Trifolium medium]